MTEKEYQDTIENLDMAIKKEKKEFAHINEQSSRIREEMVLARQRIHAALSGSGEKIQSRSTDNNEKRARFCPSCGAPAGSGNFCSRCGTRLNRN